MMLKEITQDLSQNLKRVEALVEKYETHPDAKGGGRKPAELLDILRAAVVFLHASLEDFLRGLAALKLPDASKEVLNKIPLVDSGKNPSKFWLGDLVVHRDKTVREVFSESVEQHLQQSNYNDTDDISYLLDAIGVEVSNVNSQFDILQKMMNRQY